MEAEYAALSMALRDLLPLKRLVQAIFKGVGLQNQQFNIICSVSEENAGALLLATL